MAGRVTERSDKPRAMQYFLYILECSDGTYYVGYTSDPARRLEFHQSGRGSVYTARRLPVSMVFQEPHVTLSAALKREKQVKRWSQTKKAALIAGDTAALHTSAKRRSGR